MNEGQGKMNEGQGKVREFYLVNWLATLRFVWVATGAITFG